VGISDSGGGLWKIKSTQMLHMSCGVTLPEFSVGLLLYTLAVDLTLSMPNFENSKPSNFSKKFI
jgi:hypothetical protein